MILNRKSLTELIRSCDYQVAVTVERCNANPDQPPEDCEFWRVLGAKARQALKHIDRPRVFRRYAKAVESYYHHGVLK